MIYVLAAVIGFLPVLPVLIYGSPILNNDMLVAYFAYFWDFHRNWSWSDPLVFWSSSYQCGMPMHAYWQSGYLYPITWLCFGPLSPHYGIYVFYACHFTLGIVAILALGPHLRLGRAASFWAGICYSLSGTMLARYEHATFLAGWAWMPLVLAAFLTLREKPGPKTLFLYALSVSMQALGGHPQASLATAIVIASVTVFHMLPKRRDSPEVTGGGVREAMAPVRGHIPWILGGHLLALLYCAPMLVPFLQLMERTDRFDGIAAESSAADRLEEGVFAFEEFSTGGLRPLHLLSLAAPRALGSPSNATWWGGEVWGEVFIYAGGLALFFCFFASWKRANGNMRLLWLVGLAGLWLSFGAHAGASQILFEVPVFNNFRRPARYLILFVLAMAVLSGHGFQRWLGKPRAGGPAGLFAAGFLVLAAALLAVRLFPAFSEAVAALARSIKELDPAKDYAGKISTLMGMGALDCAFLSLSGAAIWFYARRFHLRGSSLRSPFVRSVSGPVGRQRPLRLSLALLFLVLGADLLRLHWDHFYLFPSDFYRRPPETVRVLDQATAPFWRVSHYLEYPGQEMWRMHNDPVANFPLIDREKLALTHGIHAVFGYRHVTAHLPLLWKWEAGTSFGDKSARYLFSNLSLSAYGGDSLDFLGTFGPIQAFEVRDWRPRLELARHPPDGRIRESACDPGFSGHGGLCVRERRDGEFDVRGSFVAGDTLIVRERFHPEWKYRLDGGPWLRPGETADHFLSVPFAGPAARVELSYSPRSFYQTVGICLLVSLALAGFFGLRARMRPPGKT